MKWTYYLGQKLKIALAFAVVLGLVVFTNIANRSYFTRLHASFSSVYEDRLIVEGYIYQLSNILHERHLQFLQPDFNPADDDQQHSNQEIQRVLSDYEKTVFTEKESDVFAILRSELAALSKLENEYSTPGEGSSALHKISEKHAELAVLLNELSKIQIDEARNQITLSNEIVASSYYISRIEIVVIILVGLMIQILVISSRSVVSKFQQNSGLN